MDEIRCPYCHSLAVKADSRKIYKTRSYGPVYICSNYDYGCDSYVGINKVTSEPLGSMANPELRALRKTAHGLFDRQWKDYLPESGKWERRARCYQWLYQRLGIPKDECHIGMFGVDQCRRLIMICQTEIIHIPEPVYEFDGKYVGMQ